MSFWYTSRKSMDMMRSSIRSIILSLLLTLGFLLLSSVSLAQVSIIPLKPTVVDILTTDLMNSSGDVLSPLELQNRFKNKEDISLLQPKPDQQWRPQGFSVPGNFSKLPNTAVDFVDVVDSGEKMASFKAPFEGQELEFQFYRRFRNTLMRGALLEKMGYRNPSIRYMPEVTFKTKGPEEVQKIKSELSLKLKPFEDFIVSETANSITLRDALLVETDIRYYDLSQGYIIDAMIQNERKYEAVIALWAIADIEESMNKEPWSAVYIDNQRAILLNEMGGSFKTNRFDARWILRPLSKMTKDDWRDIVKKAYFPPGFEGLVTEQIVARRNSIVKTMFDSSEAESREIPVDINYSFSNYIDKTFVDYKNFSEAHGAKFPKTVTRLASPEMPTLFKDGDLWAVFKNLLKGNAIATVLAEVNRKIGIQSDIGQMIGNQMDHKLWDDIEKFAETGQINSEKTRLKPIPYRNGQILYGSDVVIGNYWGTRNNLFNRVDVLGVSVAGGWILDRTKFTNPLEYINKVKHFYDISGGIQLYLTRIKPIRLPDVTPDDDTSIVHLWRMGLIPEGDRMPPDKRLADFMANFKVGESLVLTATVAGKESINWMAPLSVHTTAFAKAYLDQQVMKRIHIHRISQEYMQVYIDDGKVLPFKGGGWEVGLQAFIPIFTWGGFKVLPNVSTNLILVDLRAPNGKDKLVHALGHLFRSFDTDEIRKLSLDINVGHDLDQSGKDFSLLTQSWSWLTTSDSFTFELPGKLSKTLYYKSYSQKTATNPIEFGFNIFHAIWNREHPNSLFRIAKAANVTSVESPLVPAETREIRYEHELTPDGNIYDQDIVVRFNEKGPSLSRDKLGEKISFINNKFGGDMFGIERFAVTTKILFYETEVQMNIHQAGILKLLSYPQAQFAEIFKKLYALPAGADASDDYYRSQIQMINSLIYRVGAIKKKFVGIQSHQEAKNFSEPLLDLVTMLLDSIPVTKFIELIGGYDNVYITGRISGFRVGDENTFAKPVVPARSLGRVDKYSNGPLAYYSQSLEVASQQHSILPFEVLAQWMIRR